MLARTCPRKYFWGEPTFLGNIPSGGAVVLGNMPNGQDIFKGGGGGIPVPRCSQPEVVTACSFLAYPRRCHPAVLERCYQSYGFHCTVLNTVDKTFDKQISEPS